MGLSIFYLDDGCGLYYTVVVEKNVPLCERFFLQPLIPPCRISEFIFEKRYSNLRPASHNSGRWETVSLPGRAMT